MSAPLSNWALSGRTTRGRSPLTSTIREEYRIGSFAEAAIQPAEPVVPPDHAPSLDARWFPLALALTALTMILLGIPDLYGGEPNDAAGSFHGPQYLGLGLLHIGVYALRPWLVRWMPVLAYLAIQAFLAAVLGVTTGIAGPTLGLVVVVTVEAVVLTVGRRPAWQPLVAGWLLYTVSFIIMRGVGRSFAALLWLAIGALFVVIVNHGRRVVAEHRQAALRAEVEDAHRRLGQSLLRVQELTRDRERQRLARDLHDTLAAGMVGLTLQLEAVDAHLAQSRFETARDIIRRAMVHARASTKSARETIAGLRAPTATFRGAVDSELTRLRDHLGASFEIDCEVVGEPPAAVRDEVLLILREALTNVARHADARRVVLRVHTTPDRLTIRLEDDGLGFDPGSVRIRDGHYGLRGIRERVERLGGELQVVRGETGGTVLRVSACADGPVA